MYRIAFIINPISGTTNKTGVLKYIGQVFGDMEQYDLTLHTTRCAGDGYEMAKYYAGQNYNSVVAVGGDGTVNEIARGLMGSKTALGIVPMGSGNGLARHLQIPLNHRDAIDIIALKIALKKTQPIDAAQIDDKIFFCTAGIGFDALIGNRFNASSKRGLQTYFQVSAKEILRYEPQEYEIIIDGKKIKRKAFLITFANASQWGNNVYIAPRAHTSDGLLDVVIWREFPLIVAPWIFSQLLTKTMNKAPYVETFRGKNITVKRKLPDYVHFDGDSCMMDTELEIKVIPLALRVLLP